MATSIRWEWPRSLTGRAQFPTRASASDQASKSREISSSRIWSSSRGVSGGRSRGASSRCPGNASGARAGSGVVTAARVWSLTGLTTPRWVCHAASAVPAARHTRFGRSAVQLGEQGSRRGDRRSAETRQTKDFADGVTSVRVCLLRRLCVRPLARVGSRPPGNMPHQFCVKLSAAKSMTRPTDNAAGATASRRQSVDNRRNQTIRQAGREPGEDALETHSSGTPLCQDTFGSAGLGWLVTGPGVACPKCRCWDCEPVALESESLSRCPPGPVLAPAAACLTASSSMVL